MGFTTHIFKCKYCKKQVIYTSRQKHPMFNHKCLNKERKQMEDNDFYRLDQVLKDDNYSNDQYDYWKKRVNERILYLTPLMEEIKSKGLNLATISKELHQEWILLIECKEYYKF